MKQAAGGEASSQLIKETNKSGAGQTTDRLTTNSSISLPNDCFVFEPLSTVFPTASCSEELFLYHVPLVKTFVSRRESKTVCHKIVVVAVLPY